MQLWGQQPQTQFRNTATVSVQNSSHDYQRPLVHLNLHCKLYITRKEKDGRVTIKLSQMYTKPPKPTCKESAGK